MEALCWPGKEDVRVDTVDDPALSEAVAEARLPQIITHYLALADAPRGYDLFQKHEDGCIKGVLTP